MNILSKLYYSHKARRFGFRDVDEYFKLVRSCCMHRDWTGAIVLTGKRAVILTKDPEDDPHM